MTTRNRPPSRRFGIGEWYGKPFHLLPADQLRQWAELQLHSRHAASLPRTARFSPRTPVTSLCNKRGGVCSLRLYELDPDTGTVGFASGIDSRLRTVCPNRFEEDGLIYQWVGETILGTTEIVSVREVGFLERIDAGGNPASDDVGRIDRVLVIPGSDPLQWCALEFHAGCISGDAMDREWSAIRSDESMSIPFPVGSRRPDYTSRYLNHLLPKLLINGPFYGAGGRRRQ